MFFFSSEQSATSFTTNNSQLSLNPPKNCQMFRFSKRLKIEEQWKSGGRKLKTFQGGGRSYLWGRGEYRPIWTGTPPPHTHTHQTDWIFGQGITPSQKLGRFWQLGSVWGEGMVPSQISHVARCGKAGWPETREVTVLVQQFSRKRIEKQAWHGGKKVLLEEKKAHFCPKKHKKALYIIWKNFYKYSKKHLKEYIFILFNFSLFFCGIFPLLFSGDTKGFRSG